MRRAFTTSTLLFLTLASASSALGAQTQDDFRLARIFTDHMVLQQEKPIEVWGWAPPAVEVRVTLTQDRDVGEAGVARAVEQGSRRAESPARDGEHSVRMQYVETNPRRMSTQQVAAVADEDGRWKAVFEPAPASFEPTWIVASLDDWALAVKEVLIGEVWVCAGQSNMAWGNFNRKGREAASADFPALRYVAWEDSWYRPLDDVRKNIRWQPCTPRTAPSFSAVPYLYGMFLHRYLKVPVGVINLARGGTLGHTWCLRGELDEIEHEAVRATLAEYDADTARWDDPAQVAEIMAAWEDECEAVKAEHARKLEEARAAGGSEPKLRLPKKPGDPRSGWSPPAGLFNATVMPIRDLAIRGVLYYQGENNNFMRWTRYEHTFPRIPSSFREAFGEPELPFGCISQPGWGEFGQDPELATVAEGYAIVRDIQTRALADDPNADMIATYPTGNSYIHPPEKLPVAEYASRWALAEVYDQPIVHRGNRLQELKIRDGKVSLFFDSDPVVFDRWKHIENNAAWQVLPSAREGNAPFEGFIVAGADRRWYPAQARHAKLDGEWSIEVWSELVEEPMAVRYGWANWPTGNMVGRERLPLPTFRTDDWPIPEGVSYSDEAKKAAEARLKELRELAKRQALDRKIRQMLLDLPELESELHKGDVAAQLAGKIDRLETVLAQLQDPGWLSRGIQREFPEAAKQIAELRAQLRLLREATDEQEGGGGPR